MPAMKCGKNIGNFATIDPRFAKPAVLFGDCYDATGEMRIFQSEKSMPYNRMNSIGSDKCLN